MLLGDRIKLLRERKELNQKELGEKLGVSASAIGMWENNRRTPDIETIKLICKVFNCELDYLVGNSFKKSSTSTSKVNPYSRKAYEILDIFAKHGINPDDLDEPMLEKIIELYILANKK